MPDMDETPDRQRQQYLVVTDGGTQVVWGVQDLRAGELLKRVAESFGQRSDRQLARYVQHCRMFCCGRVVKWNERVHASSLYRVVAGNGLLGGKGGFGAMLRSLGKAGSGSATRDFGACRDLQGRRLRHVNDEIALERWHEARRRKEDGKDAPSHGIKGWYVGVPSWAELPKFRKSKAMVRREAAERSWREEEQAVLESGAETKSWLGRVTMVDTFRLGFCAVDGDCYVPFNANCDESDDWKVEPPRVGDELRVWAAYRPKGRNTWSAYKAQRVSKAGPSKLRARRQEIVNRHSPRTKQSEASLPQRVQTAQPAAASTTSSSISEAVALGLEAAKRARVRADLSHARQRELPVTDVVSKAPSALGVVSGNAFLDGTVARGSSEFCTLQVLSASAVSGGKHYFEAKLLTAGIAQLGWAALSKFSPDDNEGDGVGDDAYSWSFDGCRQLVWHDGRPSQYGNKPWIVGDIVGCLLDADAGNIEFSLNGQALGIAFADITTTYTFLPTISLEDDEAVDLALDPQRLRYLPKGYQPLAIDARFHSSRLQDRATTSSDVVEAEHRAGDTFILAVAAPASAIAVTSPVAMTDDSVTGEDRTVETPPPAVAAKGSGRAGSLLPAGVAPTVKAESSAPEEAAATANVKRQKPPKDIRPEPLNLDAFTSSAELEKLGLDRLKSALVAVGCKCGGTLTERAARLFMTKGKSRAEWDPKILVKQPQLNVST